MSVLQRGYKLAHSVNLEKDFWKSEQSSKNSSPRLPTNERR